MASQWHATAIDLEDEMPWHDDPGFAVAETAALIRSGEDAHVEGRILSAPFPDAQHTMEARELAFMPSDRKLSLAT